MWDGEFEPPPVQRPRIPVWVAARWPNRRPVRRAVRWDGLFPIEMPGPEALAQLAQETTEARGGEPFDLVAEIAPGDDPRPWEQAGATWVLTGFGRQPGFAEVREAVAAGPELRQPPVLEGSAPGRHRRNVKCGCRAEGGDGSGAPSALPAGGVGDKHAQRGFAYHEPLQAGR